ncbi:MAG: hypothetical protein QOI13_2652 [Paraburkholderia sp.]|nr:hypothetical protein [Paraburkholderia sp.]
MRWRTLTLALFATATVCLSGTADAARWHVGVFVGGPGFYGPGYYGPGPYYWGPGPYYYPPYAPVVVQPAEPNVYTERSETSTAPRSSGTWWYCAASKSYYPYVKQCSSGWDAVPATPTPPAPNH